MKKFFQLFNFFGAKTIDGGKGNKMLYLKVSTVENFNKYLEEIKNAGFEKISNREINGNIFCTLTNKKEYLYAYYLKYNGSIRIASGPIEQLVKEDYSGNLPEKYSPYITNVPQHANGQGFIIRLPDGRFIVQDGGYKTEDRVYNRLKSLQPQGKIVIAGWFISHPHVDHYGAFIDFVKNHSADSDIVIERVIHGYTHEDVYNMEGPYAEQRESVREFYSTTKKYIPSVPVLKSHTGQVIKFGSVDVEIIYAVETMLPEVIKDFNSTSTVIRVNFNGNVNQKFLILADVHSEVGGTISSIWGEYLKSDIVQMAHHGNWPASESIYQLAKAETIIYPATVRNLKEYLKPDTEYFSVHNIALNYAKDLYHSIDEIVTLSMPHTPIGNKKKMLELFEYKA